jgi:hypothetical protein
MPEASRIAQTPAKRELGIFPSNKKTRRKTEKRVAHRIKTIQLKARYFDSKEDMEGIPFG